MTILTISKRQTATSHLKQLNTKGQIHMVLKMQCIKCGKENA